MYRVGTGFDTHAFVQGRPLYLGGIEIPSDRGLLGHSDADVLLHALVDALLGAAGIGDIGSFFPDSDMRYKGIRSTVLVRQAMEQVRQAGYEPVNADMVVICQQPKILPLRDSIISSVSELLGVPASCVMVKGKTTEGLGFTGRGEGIAAQAVVLLRKKEEL